MSKCLLVLDILVLGACCAVAFGVDNTFSEFCDDGKVTSYLRRERICIYMCIAGLLAAALIVKEFRVRPARAIHVNLVGLIASVVVFIAAIAPLVALIQSVQSSVDSQ